MTYESESISRAFYAALTPAGLAARTRTEWDEIILRDLAELLPRASRILDVGCGYGRLAVPLAVAGHQVKGLDLSPTMVEAAAWCRSGSQSRTAAEAPPKPLPARYSVPASASRSWRLRARPSA
jgi:SAM-dependent methyltransferase